MIMWDKLNSLIKTISFGYKFDLIKDRNHSYE